jgi:hypothetical protein
MRLLSPPPDAQTLPTPVNFGTPPLHAGAHTRDPAQLRSIHFGRSAPPAHTSPPHAPPVNPMVTTINFGQPPSAAAPPVSAAPSDPPQIKPVDFGRPPNVLPAEVLHAYMEDGEILCNLLHSNFIDISTAQVKGWTAEEYAMVRAVIHVHHPNAPVPYCTPEGREYFTRYINCARWVQSNSKSTSSMLF